MIDLIKAPRDMYSASYRPTEFLHDPRQRRGKIAARILNIIAWLSRKKQPPSNQPIKRIGILVQWGIGDAVIAMPLLKGLRNKYPNASLELIGKPWLNDLFKEEAIHNQVHRLVPPWTQYIHKYRVWDKSWRAYAHQVKRIRVQEFDLLVSCRWDPREILQLRLLKATRTAGLSQAGGAHWITDGIDLSRDEFNAMHRCEVAAYSTKALTRQETAPLPVFHASKSNQNNALTLLKKQGYQRGPIVAIHGGAGNAIREWPPSHFHTVMHAIEEKVGMFILIEDDETNKKFDIPLKVPHISWSGTLHDMKGLLSLSDILISNDSGIMHLGAACGCQCLSIFGPTSPEWFRPYGENHITIKVEPMPCRPCFDKCMHDSALCMEQISVEDVIESVHMRLNQLHKPAS